MAKRTSTLSVRVTPELEAQLSAIAEARRTTTSGLINDELMGLVERERLAYYRLKAAFEVSQDLPCRRTDD